MLQIKLINFFKTYELVNKVLYSEKKLVLVIYVEAIHLVAFYIS